VIGLSQLPRTLRDRYTGRVPSYRLVYSAILNGEIPAQRLNGRWHVLASDVGTIAEHFGLSLKQPQ
jgi:hypothetical protein